jgi:2-keto-4-pentenoate hydratase/2-oxohepta-3-ene-1,7-dioic acid hydratase in catechol pathway
MRLASYRVDGRSSFGLITDQGAIDLPGRLASSATDLRALLAGGGAEAARPWATSAPDHALADLEFEPVIPNPSQILCVGLNYRAHAAEVGRPLDPHPAVFLRVAASQVGHGQPILRPRVSEALDYEGELALVIGKPGRYIPTDQALSHVAGYSLYNDASLRDWQRHAHQYTPGKNFPATGAFGPWLTTADEIPDPSVLEITTRVNGQVVQHAPLSDLIFSVPEVIAYLSNFTTLQPGDVIITGTPAGVGSMRKPPLWLKPGDRVEVAIPQIGVLSNPVAQEV